LVIRVLRCACKNFIFTCSSYNCKINVQSFKQVAIRLLEKKRKFLFFAVMSFDLMLEDGKIFGSKEKVDFFIFR